MLHQDLPKKVLKSIAKSPDDKPRTILLSGPFGCGKTTLGKIFARAINCQAGTGEVCGTCISCTTSENSFTGYTEYDSSIIGNVKTLRELQDSFYHSVSDYRRVILFDEAQVISREAQSALLKVTEDVPEGVWFLFATTDPENLLPALRSRSLELELTVAPSYIIKERVAQLSKFTELQISEEDTEVIVDRASGHFRNCDMLFDLYKILGNSDFRSTLNSGKEHFVHFIKHALDSDKDGAKDVLTNLRHIPLSQLQADYEHFLTDLSRVVTGDKDISYLESIPKRIGIKALSLVKYHLSPWGLGAFKTDRTFEMYMWSVYAVATKSLSG